MIPGAQVTTVKLDETNYLEWFQSTKMYIGGRSKLGYINGRVLKPADSDSQAYKKWESENLTVMSWLFNSMKPQIICGVLFFRTAKNI